jgi:hypothetical protein
MKRLSVLVLVCLNVSCIDFDVIAAERCRQNPQLCSGAGFCQPCTITADCAGQPANFCIDEGFGNFCGQDCTSASCGPNQVCTAILINGMVGKNCVPITKCDGGVRDGG